MDEERGMQHTGRRSTPTKPLILSATLASALLLAACTRTASPQPGIIAQERVVPGGDPLVGRALLVEYNCMTCHLIPGIRGPETYVGPPLTAWAKHEYIAGNLPNTSENLVAWIVNPQAIEPGTVMPTLGVSPDEARDMAAYLYLPDEEAEGMVQPWD